MPVGFKNGTGGDSQIAVDAMMSARDVAQRFTAEMDRTEEFPWENVRAMAAMGLMGLTIPEADGGAGANYAQLVLAAEELAFGCAATSVIHLTHLSLGSEAIVRFGSGEQRQRYLPALASGERLAAFALTEPDVAVIAAVSTASPPTIG